MAPSLQILPGFFRTRGCFGAFWVEIRVDLSAGRSRCPLQQRPEEVAALFPELLALRHPQDITMPVLDFRFLGGSFGAVGLQISGGVSEPCLKWKVLESVFFLGCFARRMDCDSWSGGVIIYQGHLFPLKGPMSEGVSEPFPRNGASERVCSSWNLQKWRSFWWKPPVNVGSSERVSEPFFFEGTPIVLVEASKVQLFEGFGRGFWPL